MSGTRPPDDLEHLRRALQWLHSHYRRLLIDQRSLRAQLARLDAEVERVAREIARAEARLRETDKSRG